MTKEAEHAFIESKMRLVQSGPNSTAEEKRSALEQLERKLPPPP